MLVCNLSVVGHTTLNLHLLHVNNIVKLLRIFQGELRINRLLLVYLYLLKHQRLLTILAKSFDSFYHLYKWEII